jgi:hypothetical protein
LAGRKGGKAPVIIKRPARAQAHPRVHVPEAVPLPKGPIRQAPPVVAPFAPNGAEPNEVPDELSQIRALLFPPPIDGVSNWGIPPPPDEDPNPELLVGVISQ